MYRPTVILNLNTLIRECASNNAILNHRQIFNAKNRNSIKKVFRYSKFYDDFIDTVCCYNDGNYVIGFVHPNYDEFIFKIKGYLNYDNDCKDEELEKALLKRIEILSNIKTETELQREFPLLYSDLMKGRQFIAGVEKNKSNIPDEIVKEKTHYFYSCALYRSLKKFITAQTKLFKRFVTQREEYKNSIESSTSFNQYLNENFNMDKVAMYVIHTYLCICESNEDKNIIEQYLRLIDKYIDSDYDKMVSITLDDYGKININSIRQRVEHINKKINNISNVNWEILPSGRIVKAQNNINTENSRRVTMSEEEISRLKNIAARKSELFLTTKPYFSCGDKMQEIGYTAYFYLNGTVLLEKHTPEYCPSMATGNAIYKMDIDTFEILSGINKQTLKQHPLVSRIVHNGNWEQKVLDITSKPPTEESTEKVKAYIKRLQKKPD